LGQSINVGLGYMQKKFLRMPRRDTFFPRIACNWVIYGAYAKEIASDAPKTEKPGHRKEIFSYMPQA